MSTEEQPTLEEIAQVHARVAQTDYFQLLGVHPDSTPEAIKSSFHAMARRWHVDNFSKLTGEARAQVEEISQTINSAYETLKDPDKKKEYAVFCARKAQGKATDVHQVLQAERLVDEAVVAIKRRQWADAHHKLDEAIRLNPDDALYQVHLAWTIYNQHPKATATINEALSRLEAATEVQENLPLAYQYGGHICFQQDDYVGAKRWWKRCLQRDRNNIEAARGLRLIATREEKQQQGLGGLIRRLLGK